MGKQPLAAPVTDDPELDEIMQAELNVIHKHGSNARPQLEVYGIGLQGAQTQPVRGWQEVVERRAGKFTYMLLLFEISEYMFKSNCFNLITNPDKAILSKGRYNQATAQWAMVTRHTKNHDLPFYQAGNEVKLQLPDCF